MKILCATDFLPKSEAAVDRAGVLARQLDAELVLLHVVPTTSSASSLETALREAGEKMRMRSRAPRWLHGSPPNTIIRIGSPAKLLTRTAQEIGADLIVLGPHSPHLTRESLSGTLAARTMSERRWPVLVARETVDGAYREVLLALDVNPVSAGIVSAAELLVLHSGMNASVVHACHVPYTSMLDSSGVPKRTVAEYAAMVTSEAFKSVRELLARESNGSVQYNVVVREDAVPVAIEKAAQRVQPDLIVMGTRGYGPVRRALLGSVANRILETATSDVLVIPEENEKAVRQSSPRANAAPRAEREMRGSLS